MIKSIELKNFKSIKKKYFPLRNLTLLCGLNGMGKSSFVQSLLMLRQSSDLKDGRIDLMGQYVKIGTTKDALYQYSKQEDLSVDLIFSEGESLNLEFKYAMEADYFITKASSEDIYKEEPKFRTLTSAQALFNSNFQYLNASRVEPNSVNPKNYSSVVNSRNLGNHGEFTAHYIEVFSNDDVTFENLLHKDSWIKDTVTNKEIVNKTLINQINLWMGEISPGVNIRTTSISSDYVLLEYAYKQPNFGNTNRYKPENVGFGITYGLPVVTTLLSAKPGELIIIENPESHIHPRGQAELGRLIGLTAMNDVQIIIETHSDHILNGVRVATKEKKLAQDKVGIFYFEKVVEPSEQYSKVTNIEIDENGELSEYPENMLNEWSNQLLRLV